MKKLTYKVTGYTDVYNFETKKVERQASLVSVVIENPSTADIETAVTNAYNGKYSIEDDGVEEITEPTQLDKIEAQVVYTAMITDTLLEV